MDDATGQNRVQLHSSSTSAQLHLGYLIDHTGNMLATSSAAASI